MAGELAAALMRFRANPEVVSTVAAELRGCEGGDLPSEGLTVERFGPLMREEKRLRRLGLAAERVMAAASRAVGEGRPVG